MCRLIIFNFSTKIELCCILGGFKSHQGAYEMVVERSDHPTTQFYGRFIVFKLDITKTCTCNILLSLFVFFFFQL